jgi:hypothetical protein
MIVHIEASYKKILNMFDFEKSALINKKILLKMARRGEKKPNTKIPIGSRLHSYTYHKSYCYDKEFTNNLKKIRPDWFITQYQIANNKKKQLIKMAKDGEKRPSKRTHPLGASLGTYVNKSQRGSYDPKFTKEIKKIRPDWFFPQTKLANQKKKELISLAKSGKPRPRFKTKLGQFLGERTTKKEYKNSDFNKIIRKIRPDWFVTQAQTNKKKIIELAKSGRKKPNQKTKFGMHYYSYLRNNENFKKTLMNIRPDWFISRSEIVQMKKKKLLEMAKNGEKRPYDNLGSCLSNYVGKGSGTYDAIFTKKIKKLRPDWFQK